MSSVVVFASPKPWLRSPTTGDRPPAYGRAMFLPLSCLLSQVLSAEFINQTAIQFP